MLLGVLCADTCPSYPSRLPLDFPDLDDSLLFIEIERKAGMTLEGRLRDDVRIRGEFRDSLVYGVLEREWRR